MNADLGRDPLRPAATNPNEPAEVSVEAGRCFRAWVHLSRERRLWRPTFVRTELVWRSARS